MGTGAMAENFEKLKPLIKELPNRIVEKADQVLLGLSHTKQSIPTLLKQTLTRIEQNPNDLVGRVGRNVLERAESVRKQLIEKAEESESRLNKRWVPDWLKEVSFVTTPAKPDEPEAAPAQAAEVTISQGAAVEPVAAIETAAVSGSAADVTAAIETSTKSEKTKSPKAPRKKKS